MSLTQPCPGSELRVQCTPGPRSHTVKTPSDRLLQAQQTSPISRQSRPAKLAQGEHEQNGLPHQPPPPIPTWHAPLRRSSHSRARSSPQTRTEQSTIPTSSVSGTSPHQKDRCPPLLFSRSISIFTMTPCQYLMAHPRIRHFYCMPVGAGNRYQWLAAPHP